MDSHVEGDDEGKYYIVGFKGWTWKAWKPELGKKSITFLLLQDKKIFAKNGKGVFSFVSIAN